MSINQLGELFLGTLTILMFFFFFSGISKPVVWVNRGLQPAIPVVFVISVVSVISANPALNSLFVAV